MFRVLVHFSILGIVRLVVLIDVVAGLETCFGERFGGGVVYFYAAGTSGADGAWVYFFEAFFWLFGGR